MRAYAVTGTIAAVASSYKTTATVISATTVRPKIFELLMGAIGTPADNALSWLLQRFTADGTGTSFTPHAIDSAEAAALATAKNAYSAEPTYTANANLFQMDLHQKASYRHVCNQGAEFWLPATAANGAGLQVKSAAYTGQADSVVYFAE